MGARSGFGARVTRFNPPVRPAVSAVYTLGGPSGHSVAVSCVRRRVARTIGISGRLLSIPAFSFVSWATDPEEEEAMKYLLLIHQGDTPTPRSPEAWATLSEDEQKAVYADY